MGSNRRKKSEKSFRIITVGDLPRVANMEQVDPKSRAAHIAARRAQANGIMQVQDINGKLVGTMFDQATDRSSYNWARKEPDLPEKMLKYCLMTRDEFPVFTRPFLKIIDRK